MCMVTELKITMNVKLSLLTLLCALEQMMLSDKALQRGKNTCTDNKLAHSCYTLTE